MTAQDHLKRYFGYDAFRSGQEALIEHILAGGDVLGVMPTGAGKSICFQIPALMMAGMTLIISPLISLMKDQVNALTQSGIPAAFINSSLTERQIALALEKAQSGAYKLIYIAPERLLTYDFLSLAQSVTVSMVAVDEAHCISQWGQDFRPSYATIPDFIAQLPNRPILSAFTATATPRVREDIIELLKLDDPFVLGTGFDRPNLHFSVQERRPKEKYAALTAFLADKQERSGIIYCSTRATVEEVCENLRRDGYAATRYHAGLDDQERRENQDDFIFDRAEIIVATNAFGMGIDKSNVSFVVHYNMPKDVESYYQEAGRAGRDGESADCVLLYSGADVRTNLWLIENGREREELKSEQSVEREQLLERERKRLNEMDLYCHTTACLRAYILRYFGENPAPACGNCGSCDAQHDFADVTVEAQKILSCVARMKERFGQKMVIDVLRGKKDERIVNLGLDKLSTYGVSAKSERELREMILQMIIMGYLEKTNDEFPTIRLGERANEVLREGATVRMKLSKPPQALIAPKPEKRARAGRQAADQGLYAALRALRLSIAKKQNLPAFVIFPDSTLTDMCVKLPQTKEELLRVSGVGQVKANRYGEMFLSAIAEYLRTSGQRR